MFALARLVVIGFAVLTVIYICLWLWARSTRRAELRAEWEAGNYPGDRDAFVQAELKVYDGPLRRKLVLGVYLVPVSVIGLIVYLTNFY